MLLLLLLCIALWTVCATSELAFHPQFTNLLQDDGDGSEQQSLTGRPGTSNSIAAAILALQTSGPSVEQGTRAGVTASGVVPLGGLVKVTSRFPDRHSHDTALLGVLAAFGEQLQTFSPPLRESLVLAQPITACSPLFTEPGVLSSTQQQTRQDKLHPLTFETLLKQFTSSKTTRRTTPQTHAKRLAKTRTKQATSEPIVYDPNAGHDLSDLLLAIPWSLNDIRTELAITKYPRSPFDLPQDMFLDSDVDSDAIQPVRGTLDNTFVVVFRGGGCSFADKAYHVQQAGARGMILINERIPKLVTSDELRARQSARRRKQAKSRRKPSKEDNSPDSFAVDVDQGTDDEANTTRLMAHPDSADAEQLSEPHTFAPWSRTNREALFAMGATTKSASEINIPSILISAESGTRLLQVMSDVLAQAALTRPTMNSVTTQVPRLLEEPKNSTLDKSSIAIGDTILPPALSRVMMHAPAIEALVQYLWIQDIVVADLARLSASFSSTSTLPREEAKSFLEATDVSTLQGRHRLAESLLGLHPPSHLTSNQVTSLMSSRSRAQFAMTQLRVTNYLNSFMPDLFLEQYSPHAWDSSSIVLLALAVITAILASFYATCPQRRRYYEAWKAAELAATARSEDIASRDQQQSPLLLTQEGNRPQAMTASSPQANVNGVESLDIRSAAAASQTPQTPRGPLSATAVVTSKHTPSWAELVAGWRVDLSQFFSVFGDTLPESLLSEQAVQCTKLVTALYSAAKSLLAVCQNEASVTMSESEVVVDTNTMQERQYSDDDVMDLIVVALVRAMEEYHKKEAERLAIGTPAGAASTPAPAPIVTRTLGVSQISSHSVTSNEQTTALDPQVKAAVAKLRQAASNLVTAFLSGRGHLPKLPTVSAASSGSASASAQLTLAESSQPKPSEPMPFDIERAASRARTLAQAIHLLATSDELERARRVLATPPTPAQLAELRMIFQLGAVPVLPALTSLGVLLPIGPGFRGRLVALSIKAAAAEVELKAKAAAAAATSRAANAAAAAARTAAIAARYANLDPTTRIGGWGTGEGRQMDLEASDDRYGMLSFNNSSVQPFMTPDPSRIGRTTSKSGSLFRFSSPYDEYEQLYDQDDTGGGHTEDEDAYLYDDYDPTEKGRDLDEGDIHGRSRSRITVRRTRGVDEDTYAQDDDEESSRVSSESRRPGVRRGLVSSGRLPHTGGVGQLIPEAQDEDDDDDIERTDTLLEREQAVALRREHLRRARQQRSGDQAHTLEPVKAQRSFSGSQVPRPEESRRAKELVFAQLHQRSQAAATDAYTAYVRASNAAVAAQRAAQIAEDQAIAARQLAKTLLDAVRAATGADPARVLVDAKTRAMRRSIFGGGRSRPYLAPSSAPAQAPTTSSHPTTSTISNLSNVPAGIAAVGTDHSHHSIQGGLRPSDLRDKSDSHLLGRVIGRLFGGSSAQETPLIGEGFGAGGQPSVPNYGTFASYTQEKPSPDPIIIPGANETASTAPLTSEGYVAAARELGFLDADVDFEDLFASDDEAQEYEDTDMEDDDGPDKGPDGWSDGGEDSEDEEDEIEGVGSSKTSFTNSALITLASLFSGTYWQGTVRLRASLPSTYWTEKDARLIDKHDSILKDWQREEFGMQYQAQYKQLQQQQFQQQQQLQQQTQHPVNFYLLQNASKSSSVQSRSVQTATSSQATGAAQASADAGQSRQTLDVTLDRQQRLHKLLTAISEVQEERRQLMEQKLRAKALRKYLDERAFKPSAWDLTPLTALIFIFVASILLILLYYFRTYVSKAVLGIFIVCSTISLYYVFIAIMRQFSFDSLMHLRISGKWFSMPWLPAFLFAFSVFVVATWRSAADTNHSNAWALQNTLAIVTILQLTRVIKIRTLRAGFYLLLACLIYDVFWVFCSPHIFSRSIMVDVGTGQSHPTGLLSALASLRLSSGSPDTPATPPPAFTAINPVATVTVEPLVGSSTYSGPRAKSRRTRSSKKHIPLTLRASAAAAATSLSTSEVAQSGGVFATAASAAAGVVPEALPLTFQVPRSAAVGEELRAPARNTLLREQLEVRHRGTAARSPSGLSDSSKLPKGSSRTLPASRSLLGLGDVAIPTLFLVYLLRTDFELGLLWDAGFFVYGLIGYLVGLAATSIVVAFTHTGQPAMLYIVPSMLIPVLLLARARALLPLIWHGIPANTRRALRARSVAVAQQQASLWQQLRGESGSQQ